MVELIILNRQGISEVDKKVLALGVHWVVGPAFSNQKKFPIFSISRLQNDFLQNFRILSKFVEMYTLGNLPGYLFGKVCTYHLGLRNKKSKSPI